MHSPNDSAPSLRKTSPAPFLSIHSRQDFSRFYDHYAPLLYGHLLRQTTDSALAAFVLGEVFQTLWVERNTVNEPQACFLNQHPISWLLSVAHRHQRSIQVIAATEPTVVVPPEFGQPASDSSTADRLKIASAHRQ
ncbi:RNA polymerase sigma factor [Spirosoma pollinicola]|uniref:RNA polymerase sigma-70 region 2 domain-containing protein n=1 Tax=Spirosoma pollinicola TaxID=2057025 RepID=A0A2K8Z9V4_9BACT|nr:hypothetical protein [Spirosoma pollinicola]AUD06625.1 hypothetical protein CWM47_35125 [Spirosoma pollinicola]